MTLIIKSLAERILLYRAETWILGWRQPNILLATEMDFLMEGSKEIS